MYRNSILDRILDSENLYRAYEHVKAKGGASGVDGTYVVELFAHFRENSAEIIKQIRTRKYKPQPVLRVEIPKDTRGV